MKTAPSSIGSSSKPLFLEQQHFAVSRSIHFLRSIQSAHDHPLDLTLIAEIFRRLGDNENCNLMLSQLEQAISSLPDITDSGMQIRDCLLCCGYCYTASRAQHSNYEIEYIALKIINFAAERDYFHDSLLAMSVALIDDLVQAGQRAKKYLSDHLDEWINANYIDGIAQACIAYDELATQRVHEHLSDYNWSNSEVSTWCWGLLALNKLQRRGFLTGSLMMQIAQNLIDALDRNERFGNAIGHQNMSKAIKLSNFEVALSTLVLIACGFDRIIGVLGIQKESLEQLVRFQDRLLRGGQVVSPSRMALLTFFFFGFLSLLMRVGFNIMPVLVCASER